MKVRTSTFSRSTLILLLLTAPLLALAETKSSGLMSRRAERIESQKVEKQLWSKTKENSMMEQRFAMQHWDKHFSSVGTKRAPIAVSDSKEKQMFSTKTIDREEVDFKMSRWNERIKDLHKKAGIQMDDRAQLVADQQLYSAMLQDTQQFKDMADEVSLRDLNRYQFRRNRSDGEVPVEQAGSGQ
jgi:hypothetical protein